MVAAELAVASGESARSFDGGAVGAGGEDAAGLQGEDIASADGNIG